MALLKGYFRLRRYVPFAVGYCGCGLRNPKQSNISIGSSGAELSILPIAQESLLSPVQGDGASLTVRVSGFYDSNYWPLCFVTSHPEPHIFISILVDKILKGTLRFLFIISVGSGDPMQITTVDKFCSPEKSYGFFSQD